VNRGIRINKSLGRRSLDRKKEIRKVLIITLALNFAVSGAKISYGYLTNSVGIMSDGFHSIFDGVSNIMGLIGIRISSHPPDRQHPYGHRKYETVFTIFVGVMMVLTCIEIFKNVYSSFGGMQTAVVTTESFIIMIVTLGINIFVSTYETRMGKELSSEFLLADSKHTRSDIYVTVGVIVSLVMIRLGFPEADPIAGIIVGIVVARTGFMIIRDSTEALVDRSCSDTSAIKHIVTTVNGVKGCHEIRSRGTNGCVFVDIHVLVEPSLSVAEGHIIADRVEEKIKQELSEVVDVVVHIEPDRETNETSG
jgi:cation diffusion facilitator family transporter